jgi:nicotinamidase-related amidase
MKNRIQTALLLVDLQKAYFNNHALKEQQSQLLQKINELIALARKHQWPIFNIITVHQKNRATWTLNMLDDQRGYLFEEDEDSDTIDGLELQEAVTVRKTRDSAFYETNLLAMLRNYGIEQVVICGVSSHTCILQTAADAYAANLRVTLAKEAIASHQPTFHDIAMTILETEYRQPMQTNSELENNIQNNRQ